MRWSRSVWLLLAAAALAGFAIAGPRARRAEALGSISITSAVYIGGGSFSMQGTWEPAGNQCWGPGNEFHFYIEIYDDPDGQLPVTGTVLNNINPAPCNGDYTDPVDAADRGKGGAWPGAGQGGNTFTLSPGVHHICAILRHVSVSGNDIAASTCFGQAIGVFVVNKDFVPDNSASVQVSLSCGGGSVSPAGGPASESSPAVFGVTNINGSETCTATETQSPQGFSATGPCSAPIASGSCTIVNVPMATATPAAPSARDFPPPAQPEATATPVVQFAAPTPTPDAGPRAPDPPGAPDPLPPAAPLEESPPRAPGLQPPSTGSGGLPR